jgi:hypothetical protein
VTTVLNVYEHLLPGAGERVTDTLDAMARAAHHDDGDVDVHQLRP